MPPPLPPPPRTNRSLRVLVAEDNPTNRRVALHQLQRLGHQACAVDNGREALEVTADIQFDAILMDCQMPEMDGYEATRRIRQREEESGGKIPRLWIVALTAHCLGGEREKCLGAGMDDYLTKPTRLDDIQEALNRGDQLRLQESGAAPEGGDLPAGSYQAPGQIDRELLRELQGFGGGLIHTMTSLLKSELPPCLAEIHALGNTMELTRAQADSLGGIAHKIKSCSGNFGAIELVRLGAEMEAAAHVGSLARIKVLSAHLAREYAAVVRALEDFLSDSPGGAA